MTSPSVQSRLKRADQICQAQGLRFTQGRRDIYELLIQSTGAVGAYELLEKLSEKRGRRQAPPIVYRALDFLVVAGLAHRVDPLNAFIACGAGHSHTALQLLICEGCEKVQEVHSQPLGAAVAQTVAAAGSAGDALEVAIRYRCRACVAND